MAFLVPPGSENGDFDAVAEQDVSTPALLQLAAQPALDAI
jgi:hypothetical protein